MDVMEIGESKKTKIVNHDSLLKKEKAGDMKKKKSTKTSAKPHLSIYFFINFIILVNVFA